MKIAYFTDTFLPKIDGVVVSLISMAEVLAQAGHEIIIFCPKPAKDKQIEWSCEGVEIFSQPSIPVFVYPDFRLSAPTPRSFVRLRDFNPDIVHMKSPGPMGWEAMMGSKMLKKPLVGSFNTYFMEPEYLRLIKLERFKRVSEALWKLVIRFYNQCDVVVVPSKETKKVFQNHGSERRVVFIQQGIDFKDIRSVKEASVESIKKKYSLGKKVVLYVGRLSREKNLPLLIDSFRKIIDQVDGAQLMIVGDGPIRSELEEQCRDLDVDERVIFAGMIGHSKLLRSGIFQACQVFCTPSTSETLGLSVIEAMAAGLPIVGVSARGVAEVIGSNGIAVDQRDENGLSEAIIKLLKSEEMLEKFSGKSSQAAKRYTLEDMRESTEKLYSSLL